MIDTSVIVSSRVRLARNLSGIGFSPVIRDTAAEDRVTALVKRILGAIGGFTFTEMRSLTEEKKLSFVERYLVSSALVKSPRGALASSSDETVSVMINEEDHLREQCFAAGLSLKNVYSRLKTLDNVLNNNLRFAKGKFGFLTTCPTNVGTGMRASAMLFLPALAYSGETGEITKKARSAGLTVRGAYGEGSGGDCSLFQISNEITYGVTETEIIERVTSFVKSVEVAEREERRALYSDNEVDFSDACLRAYGILANCKKIGYAEFADLAAKVKLGLALNVLKADYPSGIDDVMVSARSATLLLVPNLKSLNEDERRAEFVNKAIMSLGVRAAK